MDRTSLGGATRSGICLPDGLPSHGSIWRVRRSLSDMATPARRFIAISCCAIPGAGLCRRSSVSTLGAALCCPWSVRDSYHHRRGCYGAAADNRYNFLAHRRRPGTGCLLGCLVPVQPQRRVAQPADTRKRHGAAGDQVGDACLALDTAGDRSAQRPIWRLPTSNSPRTEPTRSGRPAAARSYSHFCGP